MCRSQFLGEIEMNKLNVFLVGLAFVALAGCNQSSSVTMHKPGVYKGASDPLLSANTEERATALSERFSMGQLDR